MTARKSKLLFKPRSWPAVEGEAIALTPEEAGWALLGFRAGRLKPGGRYRGATKGTEAALVVVGGMCDVQSSAGTFPRLGSRSDPFGGRPHTLYLPPKTSYEVVASTDLDFAVATAPAIGKFPAKVVTPEEVRLEIRGAANMTRRVHHVIAPDFPAEKLMVVEVITPSGNWSSYPPHKHDAHSPPHEHALEEIYYYRISRPEGFALQRVYTQDRSIDETLTLVDGDLVLVRQGFHPVVAAPGCEVYYLNALAGSGRSMASTDDPSHAWIRDTWKTKS